MGKPVVRSAKAVPGSNGGSTSGVKSKDGKAGKAGKAVGKTVGKPAFQQRPGAATAGKKGFSSAEKKSAKKKQSADVYELDDDVMTDKKKRDELRRFAGVDIYEYEQPEHFDDDDDEEIDEDEAFGEDDFDRYGDVGVKKKKGSRYEEEQEEESADDVEADELDGIFESDGEGGGKGGEDDEDDEDDEAETLDEEDEETRRQKLLATVRGRKRGEEDDVSSGYVPAAMESEFSATSTAQSLSLSSLLGGGMLSKSSALKSVAKELTKLDKKKSVAVPAPTIVTARAMREAAYSDTNKTVTNWQPIVKQNREKEQLSFPLKEAGRHHITAASLVDKFTPSTSLEEEISRIVKAAGADEDTLRKGEEMELRKLDVGEVQERQAELAKMRSLLFHAEIKAKRVKAIKSKKFHKVDRKYKEKQDGLADHELEKLDPDAYRERLELREKKRAEERLTLKHKNTSKWVKHMLGRGHGDDGQEETREAIQDQIRLGEQLRQKQLHVGDSDEESAEETAADIQDDDRPLANAGEKVKGVMGMAFMQRSMSKQRDEANKLLQDLKDMEAGAGLSDDSDFDEDHGALGRVRSTKGQAGQGGEGFQSSDDEEEEAKHARTTRAGSTAAKRRATPAVTPGKKSAKLAGNPLAQGSSLLDQVAFSSGSTLSVAGPTAIKVQVFEGQAANRPAPTQSAAPSKKASKAAVSAGEAGALKAAASKSSAKMKRAAVEEDGGQEEAVLNLDAAGGAAKGVSAAKVVSAARQDDGEEDAPQHGPDGEASNPWLVTAPKTVSMQKGQKKMVGDDGKQVGAVAALRKKGSKDEEHELDLDARLGATPLSHPTRSKRARQDQDESEGSGDEDDASKNVKGMLAAPSKEQQRLMKMAFADAADMEAEFFEEKHQMLEAAKPKLVNATPGWGGWAGDGVKDNERARKTLEVSHKKTQQDKLRIKMSGDIAPELRKDKNLVNVVINERRNRKAARYLVDKAPHQFKDAEQYQRSMRMPIGADWNTSISHSKAIQPKVVVKAGKMVDPIDKPSSKTSRKNMEQKLASRAQAPVRPKAIS